MWQWRNRGCPVWCLWTQVCACTKHCCHHSFVSQENEEQRAQCYSHISLHTVHCCHHAATETLRQCLLSFFFCPFDVGSRLLPATVYCCCINLTNQQGSKKFCLRDTLEDLNGLEKCNLTSVDGASFAFFFFFFWKLFLVICSCINKWILLTQTVCWNQTWQEYWCWKLSVSVDFVSTGALFVLGRPPLVLCQLHTHAHTHTLSSSVQKQ